jgi:hypothetical protein
LDELVLKYGLRNWKKISDEIQCRSSVQCLHRWTKILKPGLTKGPWTMEEDKKLIEWIKVEGSHKWSQCAEFISGRSGKQCRERWSNTLSPNVKKGNWTLEEDYNIFNLFSVYGSKWSKIALNFPGRTENSVKNRFYSTLRRIAADIRKAGNSSNIAVVDENDGKNTSLDYLLKFYPQAFEEKKKLYIDKNYDLINDGLIGHKKKRSRIAPISNINNTFNINVNINPASLSTCSGSNTEFKLSSVEDLENMISSFSTENFNLENYLNKDEKKEIKSESVNYLLSHLSELENLLQYTKKQLVNYEIPCLKTVNNQTSSDENKVDNMFKFDL